MHSEEYENHQQFRQGNDMKNKKLIHENYIIYARKMIRKYFRKVDLLCFHKKTLPIKR
jgi:hypothetical protein